MACKKLTNVSLSEIYKRVPQNQLNKFKQFRDKNAEYIRAAQKYPEPLPKIDWQYYRRNVRSDFVKMVDEFEKKYEELNKVFGCRDQLDTKKYYQEVVKMQCEVRNDIDNYIAESNKRIKGYEAEIKRLREMIPYEQMTLEEFCINCPERNFLRADKPSFWPHTPEDQLPDPEVPRHNEDEAAAKVAAGSMSGSTDGKAKAEAPKSGRSGGVPEEDKKSGGGADIGKSNNPKKNANDKNPK